MSKFIDPKAFFKQVSQTTGFSASDIEYILLCMIKIMERELRVKGKFVFPYLGFFKRNSIKPFIREVHDFQKKRRVKMKYPGGYKIIFKLNDKLGGRLR
jgi:tRNA splicing ligase